MCQTTAVENTFHSKAAIDRKGSKRSSLLLLEHPQRRVNGLIHYDRQTLDFSPIGENPSTTCVTYIRDRVTTYSHV